MRRCLNDSHPATFSDDNAGVVGTRSAHEGVSSLSVVVPRGSYLRYLCAHMPGA